MEYTRVSVPVLAVLLIAGLATSSSFGSRRLLQWAVDDTGCRTPTGGVGECINIDDCVPMRELVTGDTFTQEEAKETIQKYHCSYARSMVKVCCPPDSSEWSNACETPNGESGTCKSIYSCQPMLDFIQKGNIGTKAKTILNKYTCGQESNGNVKVCCPKGEISLAHRNLKLLPTACGISNPLDRITNGMKTDLYEFPWQAALKYNSNKAIPFHCGGSLINDRYILTAAHCIESKYAITGVRLGEYDVASDPDCIKGKKTTTCAPPPQDFDVSKADVITHPAYDRVKIQNDIALIRLPRKANFTDAVGPVCLPYKDEFTKKDFKNLTVIGWGITETGYASTILLKVTIPYVNNEQCLSTFGNQITLSEKQFCAGGKEGKDSCNGDSGSPIMFSAVDDSEIRWIQAGLVSYGTRICGSEQIPAVYTKIQEYMDWILDNIKP